MNRQIEEVAKIWPSIEPLLVVPHTQGDYDRLVHFIDSLVDEVGNNESHPLATLMETVCHLIETYESEDVSVPEGSPANAIKVLMEEHGLRQSDLSDIGSQGVVSEILSGKRQLNVRQIKLLSDRFHVSPEVFF